ncbi:MAG: hypothetical protein ACRDRS_12295 [Pseudonocardiaceae bacterium]
MECPATVLAEHVRAVVDSFPPLTPEQRDRIATLRTIRRRRHVTGRASLKIDSLWFYPHLGWTLVKATCGDPGATAGR